MSDEELKELGDALVDLRKTVYREALKDMTFIREKLQALRGWVKRWFA